VQEAEQVAGGGDEAAPPASEICTEPLPETSTVIGNFCASVTVIDISAFNVT
jgi:hypothetical protein